MGSSSIAKKAFWNSFIRSVQAVPEDIGDTIRGKSGYTHPIIALGVDEGRHRLIVVSGESDARAAAFAQSDIQAQLPEINVVMARPSAVNLGSLIALVRNVIAATTKMPDLPLKLDQNALDWGTALLKQDDFKDRFITQLKEASKDRGDPFGAAELNYVSVWKDVVQQLALVKMEQPTANLNAPSERKIHTFDFTQLAQYEPVNADRGLGICSVPLYNFSGEEFEVFHRGIDTEETEEILKRYDVFQYFFPPPDQLLLGVVEKDSLSPQELLRTVEQAPTLGHPFGAPELIDPATKLTDLIRSMEEKGYVVEGEQSMEITIDGIRTQSKIKFTPREGFVYKLMRMFPIKVDLSLKDLISLFGKSK